MATRSIPDGVVAPGQARDLELRADAVGRGDEHRLVVLLRVQREESAESADAPEHPGRDACCPRCP